MNTKKLPEKSTELDLGELTLPELVEMLHRVADEIQIRMMQAAGDD
jgi:hypothetical protein